VQGVSGGQFGAESAVADAEDQPTLSQTINSRVIGSRFQEVNRNSIYGRLPLGSRVRVDQTGELGPAIDTIDEHGYFDIPDPRRFGPNHGMETSDDTDAEKEEADWVDIWRDRPRREDSIDNQRPGPSSPFRRAFLSSSTTRDDREQPSSSTKRETFPFRRRVTGTPDTDEQGLQPPHLRLQPAQPFVRPHDGINFDHLGVVYSDITLWRSKLKSINAEIADAQNAGYLDISDGVRIKGWLMIGRGLRHVKGMQLIEGMAKEDIRWDVLQHERGALDAIVLWCLLGVACVLLAAGRELVCSSL
jgi:hypothetical protein